MARSRRLLHSTCSKALDSHFTVTAEEGVKLHACTAAAHAGHERLPDTAAFLASLQRLAATDGTAALSPEQQAARDAFRWVWAWVQVLKLPMYASTNGLCEAKGTFLVTGVKTHGQAVLQGMMLLSLVQIIVNTWNKPREQWRQKEGERSEGNWRQKQRG